VAPNEHAPAARRLRNVLQSAAIDADRRRSPIQLCGCFGTLWTRGPLSGWSECDSETVSFGSNPNLKPETGDAITLGMVYSSDTLRGLEASLSYFSVHIANYIFAPLDQALIDNPTAFPGAVIRNRTDAPGSAAGFLGQIIAVNDSYFNFGDLRREGSTLTSSTRLIRLGGR